MSKSEMIELEASSRTALGKNFVNKLRQQGEFPAVMYGHGDAAVPLTVNQRQFFAATHSHGGAHSVMKLTIGEDKKSHTVMIKSVQRHPLRHDVLHVDFQEARMDESIQATIPLVLIGQPIGVKLGGVIQHGAYEVTVEALPADVPDQIEVDISGLGIGDHFRVSELPVMEKTQIVSSLDDIIASVVAPRLAEEAAPAAEEAVAAPEVAEGEEAPTTE